MPLIDLAEAARRGELIVDEFDALNAINVGKLSELESARISPIIAAHTMSLRSAANGNGEAGAAATSSNISSWDGVLVDEVELARAAAEQANANITARGPSHARDAHVAMCLGVIRASQEEEVGNGVATMEGGEQDRQPSIWRTVLVDEVDFKHAVQHGNLAPDNNHICSLHYEDVAPIDDGAEVSVEDELLSETEETDDDNIYG